MPLRRFGFYCGIISPILWLALIATAGALRPDFSHVTNYISELAERGSATEALMRYGAFGVTGFLYVGFAAAVLATFRVGWLQRTAALLIAVEGIGRMGAGLFPCDPGCVHISPGPNFHTLFATIGFCSGIVAAFLWAALARDIAPLRCISSLSVGSGAVAVVSLLLMSWASHLGLPPGLFEHAATTVLSVWLLVFASRLVWVTKAGGLPVL
jgi:hypothetical membrane protein